MKRGWIGISMIVALGFASGASAQGAADPDGDGFNNATDNCPLVANPLQADTDADGLGNACDDKDNRDPDDDNIISANDNCPFVPNPGQEDTDATTDPSMPGSHDPRGDACSDYDSDGILDDEDNCPTVHNGGQNDHDNDGIGDSCDGLPNDDLDRDGVLNEADNCPFSANPQQIDSDGDGFGEPCDHNTVSLAGGVGCSVTPLEQNAGPMAALLLALAALGIRHARRVG